MGNSDDDDNELDELFSFGMSPGSTAKEATSKIVVGASGLGDTIGIGATTPATTGTPSRRFTPHDQSYVDNICEKQVPIQDNDCARNEPKDLFGSAVGNDAGSRDFLEWLDAGDAAVNNTNQVDDISGVSSVASVSAPSDSQNLIITKDDSFDFEAEIWGASNSAKGAENSQLDGNKPVHIPMGSSNADDVGQDIASESNLNHGDNNCETIDTVTASIPQNTPAETVSKSFLSPFSSLPEALLSAESSATQLRHFINSKGDNPSENKIIAEHRKHLYVKLLCNSKTFDEVKNSSLAFSYTEWSSSSQHEQRDGRFHQQATFLSHELYPFDDFDDRRQTFYSNLTSLLTYYNLRNNNNVAQEMEDDSSSRFFSTIAAVLLHILESPPVTSVVMQSFLHVLAPILPLSSKEQGDAAQYLAKYWYLLCVYHIPVVVMHLDRYLPGWHCPRINIISSNGNRDDIVDNRRYKDLESKGVIPLSWLMACFAGRPQTTDTNIKCCPWEGGFPLQFLIHLWDVILLQPEGRSMSSLKFFIALRVLEQRADEIMQIRDSDLLQDFLVNHVFSYSSALPKSTTIVDGDKTSLRIDDESCRLLVFNLTNKALALQESTPVSFLSRLSTLDDEVVSTILKHRQQLTLTAIKDQLDEEARSHAKREEERKKEEELELNREIKKKLRVYYEAYNPEKVSDTSLDLILKVYKGRIDELNEKLAGKYGARFLTTEQVQNIVSEQQRFLLNEHEPSKSQQSLKDRYPEASKFMRLVHLPGSQKKRNRTTNDSSENDSLAKNDQTPYGNNENSKHHNQVALLVSASEVLPHVCASKTESSSPLRRSSSSQMKFFLLDSRPVEIAKAQGKFPTSANLPPEAFDLESIEKEVERFESFRGSVHLVIMGEGISAIPSLYGHALTSEEQTLAQEDDSRTERCALFFIKRGFPHVSILNGGFSASHSFLYREKLFPLSQVLVDYDENSTWAKLERNLENPAGEISKQMTSLIGGMTRINKTFATVNASGGNDEVNINQDKANKPRLSSPSNNSFGGMSLIFVKKDSGAGGGAEFIRKGKDSASSLFSDLKSLSGTDERPLSPWTSFNLRSKTPSAPKPATNTISAPIKKNLFTIQQNLFAARKVAASTSTVNAETITPSFIETRQPSYLNRFGFNLSTQAKQKPTSKDGNDNFSSDSIAVNKNSHLSKEENENPEEIVIMFDVGDVSDNGKSAASTHPPDS